MFKPELLDNNMPLQVFGDGNCLYRALSRALYGCEEQHLLLRLLTALEIAEHREVYDPKQPGLTALIGDRHIDCPTYSETLKSVCGVGAYQEMIHIYGASSVIGQSIASHHPSSSELLSAWTRRVTGRGVRDQPAKVKILWSAAQIPGKARTVQC